MNEEEIVLAVANQDEEFVDVFLESVRPEPGKKNAWSVSIADGCSLFIVPDDSVDHGGRDLPAPMPGDALRLWGENANLLGSVVRGIALLSSIRHESVVVTKVHTLYRYRSRKQEDERHQKWVEERDAELKKRWESKREATASRIAALPEPFRERIEFFMRRPNWGWEFGLYELFCCEEAVKIVNALKTRERIEGFGALKTVQQKMLVPELSDDHSGNTFGAAVTFAHWFVVHPKHMVQVHGAMCPAVGCKNYGCWAAEIAEHVKDGVLIGTSVE